MKITMQNIKKKICLILFSPFVTLSIWAQNANDIIGIWRSEDQPEKIIEITLKDGLYFGNETNKEGKMVLKALKYNPSTLIYQGIMEPKGKSLSLNVNVQFVNTNKLKTVAKKFLLSKTIYLIRVK
jgi:hypothetical protein